MDFSKSWREVLDRQYSDPEYVEIMSSSDVTSADQENNPKFHSFTNFLSSFRLKNIPEDISTEETAEDHDAYCKRLVDNYEAIRFPSIPKPVLPSKLEATQFSIFHNHPTLQQELVSNSVSTNSVPSSNNEFLDGVLFLESMLSSHSQKASILRDTILENGSYIISLQKPPQLEESEYLSKTVLDNLLILKSDSETLLDEMKLFESQRIHEVVNITEGCYYSQQFVNLLEAMKNLLIENGTLLYNEMTVNILLVDHLHAYARSLVNFPPEPYCPVDGIIVDWEPMKQFQLQHCKRTKLAMEFFAFMSSKGHKICYDFYSFLQNDHRYNWMVKINNYSFDANEFQTIIKYMARNYLYYNNLLLTKKADLTMLAQQTLQESILFNNITHFDISNCSLNDSQFHAFTLIFHYFKSLRLLNLRHNKLSYSGITSLVMNIFEHKGGANLEFLFLDYNRINTDGAVMISQILPYLPKLERLTLSHNPIKDQGAYFILKSILNPFRKAYANFPHLDTLKAAKKPNKKSRNNNNRDEDEDDSEEEEEVEDFEFEEINTTKKRSSELRYPKTCYLQDYFAISVKLSELNPEEFQEHFIDYSWVNNETEEFYMDIESDYSSDEEEEQDESKEEKEEEISYQQRLQSYEKAMLAKEEEAKLKMILQSYPKIIQKFLKIRLKLIAIAMFQRVSRRTKIPLKSINLAHCQLTCNIMPVFAFSFRDNNTIFDLDVSGNPTLLNNVRACKSLISMIDNGVIQHLAINETGLKDSGLLLLQKPFMNSAYLNHIALSENYLGPTAANILCSMNKVFAPILSLAAAKVRTAPFPKNVDSFDEWDEWEQTDQKRRNQVKLQKQKLKKSFLPQSDYLGNEEISSEASFVDYDDDSEDDSEDEDSSYHGFFRRSHRHDQSEENDEFDEDNEDHQNDDIDQQSRTDNHDNEKKPPKPSQSTKKRNKPKPPNKKSSISNFLSSSASFFSTSPKRKQSHSDL